ncbi:thioredoxin TrxA [Dolosigranulum pigrum]|uniref:thioredoxin TrxA n=1 Tax=Dolosigranulum pigrum TaxID=29394 RepID=UPI001FCC7591|nr:thioredoxin domain-containing protein [Dolosigranulum pigrum]
MMLELNLDNFDQEVVEADEKVLVDWWGESCTDCIALMPTVEKMAEKYGDDLKFTKFNTSQKGVRRFCIKHRILGLPVISIYENGEKVDELTKEEMDEAAIEAFVKKHI